MSLNLLLSLQTKEATCRICKKEISVPEGMDVIECNGEGVEHELIFAEMEGEKL